MTVTYSTGNGCNTKAGLLKLLEEYPEGIEIYIRDLPHAVLLTRYDSASDTFYVADPVYGGERTLMTSWDRKAGSTQDAVIRTIDAYWYISGYKNEIVPGGLVGNVYVLIDNTPDVNETNDDDSAEIINDIDILNLILLNNQEVRDDKIDFIKSTIKLPYVNNYNEINFIDVDANAWYAPSIKAAYEMAMMIGISDKEFHVNGNITLAQTICIAARLHNIYYENEYDFTPIGDEPWYMPYVRYTKEKGIIDDEYDYEKNMKINYDAEALRIEFSEILSKALPADQLTAIKNVNEIADVPLGSNEARFDIVYQLYNAGILIGDGEGFKPWKEITRAEIAAVISRMGDASLRVA